MPVDDGPLARNLFMALCDAGIRAGYGHATKCCYVEKATMDHHLIAAIKHQVYQPN